MGKEAEMRIPIRFGVYAVPNEGEAILKSSKHGYACSLAEQKGYVRMSFSGLLRNYWELTIRDVWQQILTKLW